MIDWQALRDTTGVLALLETADGLGLARARCLAGARIDAGSLEEPFANVRAWQELTVIRNLQTLAPPAPPGDPLGLLVAPRYGVCALGILGLGMAASPTVAEAFKFVGAYQTFGLSFSRMRTAMRGGVLTVDLDEQAVPDDCQVFCVERGLAAAVHLIRELPRRRFIPALVELRMPPSDRDVAYRDYFGVGIRYGAPRNRVVFPAGVGETELPDANRKTRLIAERYCAEIRATQVRAADLDRRIQAFLAETRFRAQAGDVATAVGVSARSLRRHLASRGTTLRRMIVDARMAHARALLAGGAGVEQVALAVGYSEAASFSRAFSRYVGVRPSAYRHDFPI